MSLWHGADHSPILSSWGLSVLDWHIVARSGRVTTLVSYSTFFLSIRFSFDHIMAPDPKKHSLKKGKARMYLCSACNTRHASPTGAKCEAAHKRKASESDSTQSSGREKRRRTTGLPRHSSPCVAPQSDSLEEESMNELLARLDGPPFPTD